MNVKPPPKIFEILLLELIHERDRESLLGDFQETYQNISNDHGRFRATCWYCLHIAKLIPAFISNIIYWSFIMLGNYWKITIRNIKKNKSFSLINIAGLAVGMACCILIMLWVRDELNYDRFNTNYNRIYRVIASDVWNGKRTKFVLTSGPYAPAMKGMIPSVECAVRFDFWRNILISNGPNKFIEEKLTFADPDIFKVFTFPLKEGSPQTALSDPSSAVISERAAAKYFGTADPMGKTLTVLGNGDFTVTGVLKNIPANSHITLEVILPFKAVAQFGKDPENWGNFSFYTYVTLKPGHKSISSEMLTKIHKDNVSVMGNIKYNLQPLRDIHLRSHYIGEIENSGDILYVYVFSAIALLILLIACINFMNLSTARSLNRAKEIGLRKVVGADRGNLIRQFFNESILLSFISLLLALIIVRIALPAFNSLAQKNLTLNGAGNGWLYLQLLGITLFTGIVAGSYPALYLSGFQPVKVLKGIFSGESKRKSLFRNTLVILQFSLSITLITGTITVKRQLNYMRNKKLGFNIEHLLTLPLRKGMQAKYDVFREDLLKNPDIVQTARSSDKPFWGINSTLWKSKDESQQLRLFYIMVDEDFINTLGIDMASGRAFSREFTSDTSAVILNETAANSMGYEDKVGQKISIFGDNLMLIGIVKDFHFERLNTKIAPLCMFIDRNMLDNVFIKIQSDDVAATIAAIRAEWEKLEQKFPFDFKFLDEGFDRLYRSEVRIGEIFKYFSFLAVFISCLGLYGLASYMMERRFKEIGIRKTLGASSLSLTGLLIRQFLLLVLIANVIAVPAGWFFIKDWLQDFAYRTEPGITVFIFAGAIAVIIALGTVSYQTLKAARSNPVDSLKQE